MVIKIFGYGGVVGMYIIYQVQCINVCNVKDCNFIESIEIMEID